MKKICPVCQKVEIPEKVEKCADCWFREKYPERVKELDQWLDPI